MLDNSSSSWSWSSSSYGNVAFSAQPVLVAAATLCGNGILEPPEECDDTNRRDGDGCNASCLMEIGICGDGKVQKLLGEQCESSTFDRSLPYECVSCRFVSKSCGDGVPDPGEECDDGPMNSTSPDAHCRPDCSISRCGDGIRDTGEQCDDANRRNGDGCSSACRTETAAALSSQSSSQTVVAGAQYQENIPFPQFANYQPLNAQLPFGQLQPLLAQAPQTTQSGPAAVAAIGAGAAAGFSWMRRRRK